MWNAIRLLPLVLFMFITATGCGSSANEDDDTVVTQPTPGDSSDSDSNTDKDQDADTQKPVVISTDPAHGSQSISPDTTVSAHFNQSIDPASVTQQNATLSGPDGQVTTTVAVADKSIVITPVNALANGETYTATIGAGIKNTKGRNLDSDYTWQFQVVLQQPSALPAPTVVSVTPVDQAEMVSPDTLVSATFDQAIAPESVTASSVRLVGPNGDVAVDLAVDDKTVTMSPASSLAYGTSYTAIMGDTVTGTEGTPLAQEFSWQFVTEKAVAGVCANFYSSDFALIEGKDTTSSSSSLSKPLRGTPYTDPAYSTCVTRGSDAIGELGIGWVRNDYSRRQAFNADDSRYLVIGRYGRWFIHDTDTTKLVRELPLDGGSVEPHWHPTDPDVLFLFDSGGGYTIKTHNVKTDERRIVADFRKVAGINGHTGLTSIVELWPDAARVWTRWEGSPSRDARYWGLMVQTSDQQGLGMITYDMETNTITGVYDYARDGGGVAQPDHVSMSPSGSYIVPSWASPACSSISQLGTRSSPCGLMSFSRDFSRAAGLSVKASHSDIGIDANGRDVIVGADYGTGYLEMWDLGMGTRTHLWNIYENGGSTALHVSAKSFSKPGWVLVSTYAGKGTNWYMNKIMAVEMTSYPRILNIAHTYNTYSTYWTEPHASVNRDFTRIMFNSNWRSGNEDADAYMITLPEHAVPAK